MRVARATDTLVLFHVLQSRGRPEGNAAARFLRTGAAFARWFADLTRSLAPDG
jgi:hypothetical protein